MRRFGHEVHAAEEDDAGLGFCRHARKFQRVAGEVGGVLHLGP